MRILTIPLNSKIWREVDTRVAKLPIFNNSHRKKSANIVGCLGEVITEIWLKSEAVGITAELDQTTHDYRLNDGSTFDVKTKDRTVSPKPDFDCSIPLYNHAHQQPDYYVFVSLQRDRDSKLDTAEKYHTAHILGSIDQLKLNEVGKIWKRGQVDQSNGTKFWTDCKNIKVDDLLNYEATADSWFLKNQ